MFTQTGLMAAALLAAVALTVSPANAANGEVSAMASTLTLYSQPSFTGAVDTTVNPAQGTCITPEFVIQSARVTGTLVVDLMSGENCDGVVLGRVTDRGSAPITVGRSAYVLHA